MNKQGSVVEQLIVFSFSNSKIVLVCHVGAHDIPRDVTFFLRGVRDVVSSIPNHYLEKRLPRELDCE